MQLLLINFPSSFLCAAERHWECGGSSWESNLCEQLKRKNELFREKLSDGKIKNTRYISKREQGVGRTEKSRSCFLIVWLVSIGKAVYFLLDKNMRSVSFFTGVWRSMVISSLMILWSEPLYSAFWEVSIPNLRTWNVARRRSYIPGLKIITWQ